MFRRTPLVALALVAGVAAGAPNAVPAASAPTQERTEEKPAEKKLSPRQARIKQTGCKRFYSAKRHRSYVVRTYRSSRPLTEAKHHRSYVMSRCQTTVGKEVMAKIKWGTARRNRQAIFRRYGTNRGVGYLLLRERRELGQFSCLLVLYNEESGWSVYADNPKSSAYGIPQALPGSKMSSHGADWATSPRTQIRWGLDYNVGRYGSHCNAKSFQLSNGWY